MVGVKSFIGNERLDFYMDKYSIDKFDEFYSLKLLQFVWLDLWFCYFCVVP